MLTAEQILDEVRKLPEAERGRVIEMLAALGDTHDSEERRMAALDQWLVAAGSADSGLTDVSSNKYKYLADASKHHRLLGGVDTGPERTTVVPAQGPLDHQKPTGQPVVLEVVGFAMTIATRLGLLLFDGFGSLRLMSFAPS